MLFSILKKISIKGSLEIIDAEGNSHTFGNSNPYVKIKFKNPSVQKKIFLNPSLHLGEAYMNGDLLIQEGHIADLINIVTASYDDIISNHWLLKIYEKMTTLIRPFQQLNRIAISKKNVAHHYDLDESLYRLFLDNDMQYSCGYFHNENIGLDQAQLDKKIHIIKKLNIKKKMKILDIGCGWGGLALQIAKEMDVNIKGITLSINQLNTAQRRAQEEGLNDKVKFALQDYRDEKDSYDRIVSVGMFEHVGVNYFDEFLTKSYQLLNDTGVFLLHTIGYRGKPSATNPWMRKYIFPGGYIPSLSEILKISEKHKMIVSDIEILRLHYAYTLNHWYRNALKNKEKIIKIFDERFFRMWEFYLLASEYSFRNMGNVVFQIQLSKNINNLPLTRNYIYS